MADPFAAPLPDLLAGCDAVASCLLDAGLALQALPVLALYEHLALHAARDVGETLHCRQLRVAACCQLGLLAEASRILLPLMAGRSLPDPSSAQRESAFPSRCTPKPLRAHLPAHPWPHWRRQQCIVCTSVGLVACRLSPAWRFPRLSERPGALLVMHISRCCVLRADSTVY